MDKQMIEEMASCLIGKAVTGADSTRVLCLGYITVKEISSILINAGYRKIPEGAVVLTREEIYEYREAVAEEVDKWKRKAIHYYNLAKSTGVYCIVDDDEICKELLEGE